MLLALKQKEFVINLPFFCSAILAGTALAWVLKIIPNFWQIILAIQLLFFIGFLGKYLLKINYNIYVVNYWLLIALIMTLWTSNPLYHQKINWQQDINCNSDLIITDFERYLATMGYSITANVHAKGNCPFNIGDKLYLRSFTKDIPQLGAIINADLKLAAKQRYIFWNNYAASLKNYRLLSLNNDWRYWRFTLSKRIDDTFAKHNARWFNALLVGKRSDLSKDDYYLLRATGTNHLLAISGLHLAIIAAIIFFPLQQISAKINFISQRIEPRTIALLVTLFISAIYVLLSGAQAPVLRAWIMLACLTGHWFYQKLRSGLNALMWAAIIILFFNPKQIISLSAWLSFGATALVIVIYNTFNSRNVVMFWLIAQTILTIALLPITWAFFGGFSLYGLFTNLILIPWLGFLLLISLLSLFLSIFLPFAEYAMQIFLNTLKFFANLSPQLIELNWQPNYLVAVSFFICCWCLVANKFKIVTITKISFTIFIFSLLWQYFNKLPSLQIMAQKPLLAIINHNDDAIIVNAGYRTRRFNQVERFALPRLRRHAAIPKAIIINDISTRATTAIKTWLHYYPDIKIYSVVIADNLPFSFAIPYCPKDAISGIKFVRGNYCTAIVSNRYQIDRYGITILDN